MLDSSKIAKPTRKIVKSQVAKKSKNSGLSTKTRGKSSEKAARKPISRLQKPITSQTKSGVISLAKTTNDRALLVVESPAKAKTLKKYLGSKFSVQASVGHVKDLPKSKIGVDLDHNFTPQYEIIRGKTKIIADLRKAAKQSDIVYLAPDPDREGEAIAWHIAEELKGTNPNIKRVMFHEITQRGVRDAMAHPTELDPKVYDAQQTRRIMDRLVGYQISPLLWNKVKPGLSAGRVQSVAVRIIVEREQEIGAFHPQEYWSIEVTLQGKNPPPFLARLVKIDEKKLPTLLGNDAHSIAEDLRKLPFSVLHVEHRERRRYPFPPFTTSKLQQEAAHKLRFSAKRTMSLAQRLYEGVELGKEGSVGLITYMRTDSVRLSLDSVQEIRNFISNRYGAALLPKDAIAYKNKGGAAQDAHEAIRPTSIQYDPDTVRRLLSAKSVGSEDQKRELEDLIRLYQLIWNRFVACQMKPAVYDQTLVDIKAGRYELRASGQVLVEPGFTLVYEETLEQKTKTTADPDEVDEQASLPSLTEGESLTALQVDPNQHFTQPPPRFSEATLVKELEENGIGRPSTYANILSTIQERGYVEKKEGRFVPTLLGQKVNSLLVQSFPDILDVEFTAQMENNLDKIEEGEQEMKGLLTEFYKPFKKELDQALVEMKDLRHEEIPTSLLCEKCGKPMVIKWGRNGEFLACTGYPECKNTKEFTRTETGEILQKEETKTEEVCPTCGANMVVKRGRFGEFLACSRYPECKTTKPITLGIPCPKPGCDGTITEKRSKRGTVFYGCTNYSKTKCDFVSWDRPVKETCPQCGAKYLFCKETREGRKLRCATCNYRNTPDEE